MNRQDFLLGFAWGVFFMSVVLGIIIIIKIFEKVPA